MFPTAERYLSRALPSLNTCPIDPSSRIARIYLVESVAELLSRAKPILIIKLDKDN